MDIGLAAPPLDARLATTLRTAMVGLALSVALGAAAELAMLRHWNGVQQRIPWLVTVLVAGAAAALLARRSAAAVLAARVIGLAAAAGGGYGVLVHVQHNWQVGPFDARHAQEWTSLSLLHQLWLAATGSVGAAPPLAPGMLTLAAVCLLLGTLGHPIRRSRG